jgi:hypothetical protein
LIEPIWPQNDEEIHSAEASVHCGVTNQAIFSPFLLFPHLARPVRRAFFFAD